MIWTKVIKIWHLILVYIFAFRLPIPYLYITDNDTYLRVWFKKLEFSYNSKHLIALYLHILFPIVFNFKKLCHSLPNNFFSNQAELYISSLFESGVSFCTCMYYILCKKSFHIKWCNSSNTWQHVYAFICQDAMTFCVYWSEFESKNKNVKHI